MPMVDDDDMRLRGLLDAWAALCEAVGRGALRTREALTAGTEDQRRAVAAALVRLGHPEAMRSPQTLGATLRGFVHRDALDGRHMARSGTHGGYAWYVVPPASF